MALRRINKDHSWRVVANLVDGDDYIMSVPDEKTGLSLVDDAFKQGALVIREFKDNNPDWTVFIPMHRIMTLEVYEDDTIVKPDVPRMAHDPKLRGARMPRRG
jgi:hypothetical protein